MILTLADDTQKVIDLTRFVYFVVSIATVAMRIQDRTITATIVDGSVIMNKLDATIQIEFRQYMLDAQPARDAALQYQTFAKRYTLGDQEFPGSKTDNAKYYYEQVKAYVETSVHNVQAAGTSEQVARDKATEAEASRLAADQSATAAQASAKLSKRFAVGGEVPEDAQDNAKWYCEQAKSLKEQVDQMAKILVPRFYVDPVTMKFMSETEATGIRFWYENGKFYGEEIIA